jgi:hypothetical protein
LVRTGAGIQVNGVLGPAAEPLPGEPGLMVAPDAGA